MTTKNDLPPVGQRIRLTSKHPWHNESGTVLSHDELMGYNGTMIGAKVVLDCGQHVYVFAGQWCKER